MLNLTIDISNLWLIQFLKFLIQTPQGYLGAFAIVTCAGLSHHLGQSFILLINHVIPRRFFFSLSFSICLYILGYYIWIGSLLLVLNRLLTQSPSLVELSTVVAVAYIPRLFDVFLLLPHFGSVFAKLLAIISFLLLTFLLEGHYSLSLIEALLCSSLGFAITSFFRHTAATPYVRIARFLKQRVTKQKVVR